jgi:hypothetical protein
MSHVIESQSSQGRNPSSYYSKTTQNLGNETYLELLFRLKYSAVLGFDLRYLWHVSIVGLGNFSTLGADHVDDDLVGNRLQVAGGRQNAMSSKARHSKSHMYHMFQQM